MITRRVINATRYRRQGERRTRHRHAAVTASSQLCRSRERSATRSDFARRRLYPGRRSSPPGAGSQKWEPTCSAALRRSATHPECSRRSRAPRSTQSDGDRLRKPPWTSLTRKRSLVQIQYGPPGISCSWPYQVALRGPITGPRARAEDMPRSQAHGHHRGRAQAQMLLCRRATERFRAEEALPGFRTAYLCTDRRSAPILSESVYDSTLRHPSARSFAIRRADVARRAMWRRANLDVDMLVVGAKREPSRPA